MKNNHHFSRNSSSKFLAFDSCVFIFLCFYFVRQTENYLASHLLVYSKAGIESYSVRPLLHKI